MTTSRRAFSFGAVLSPLAFLVSCGTSSVIQALQLAVDAAAAAIPIVAAEMGVPAATVTKLLNYLQQISQAINGAAVILASGQTAAQEATAILALFAGIAVPDLTGIPAAIVQAIQLVAQDVGAFLANYHAIKVSVIAGAVVVSSSDLQKLLAIQGKCSNNLVAIGKARR